MPRKARRKKPVDLAFAFELPPEAAMKYFRSKGHVLSWNWQDTMGEAHAKAFTVAKVARMDILQDIRGAVDNALADGQTFREFRKNLEPTLKKKGWWGRKMVVNKKGVAESVLEGSPHRLRTIYNTNMKSAYNAGREEFFQKNKANRPYGQFVAVIDPKTRSSHARLNGKVFHLDDPFWSSFTPPLDFNCRCRKRALSESAVKKRGLKVESSEGKMVREDQVVSKKTGEVRKVNGYTLQGGGKIFPRAGFDNNPWKAAWQPNLDKYDYDIASKYVEGTVTGPDFKRFFDEKIGGNFPVAIMNEKTKTMMSAKSQTVKLSSETLKQLKKHREIDFAATGKFQEIINKGYPLNHWGTSKYEIQFIGKIESSSRVVSLKKTKDSVYVSTFFSITEKQERILARFKKSGMKAEILEKEAAGKGLKVGFEDRRGSIQILETGKVEYPEAAYPWGYGMDVIAKVVKRA